ncbi:MAG: response regulator [Actinomycetota bacterium]
MPKKLLLAEDSVTIRKVFELALSRSDIAITAVDNGEDAVRLASEISPDLVVADITLSGKNGFTVAAELRAMEKTETIPVILLSGTLVPLDEGRIKASGARGVLFKPFEARELVENIDRFLREGTAVPEPLKTQEAPPADEHWDFSDVMDEVEAASRKAAAPAAAQEELLPGAILPGGTAPAPAFNEFDVSIDEIEEGARDFPPEAPSPEPPGKVEHMEPGFPMDSPPPVTDLSPAQDEVEGVEEIERLEEVEAPMPPAGDVSAEAPASLRILSVSAAETGAGEPAPDVDEPAPTPSAAAEPVAAEPAVAEHAVEESHPAPPASPISPPADAGPRAIDADLRALFTGRAEEIFRTVASEAVEKVMWEMTDRLAAEFSAKLRESVEAVAWEVIPSTAEALIREEIARIRGKAGKSSP